MDPHTNTAYRPVYKRSTCTRLNHFSFILNATAVVTPNSSAGCPWARHFQDINQRQTVSRVSLKHTEYFPAGQWVIEVFLSGGSLQPPQQYHQTGGWNVKTNLNHFLTIITNRRGKQLKAEMIAKLGQEYHIFGICAGAVVVTCHAEDFHHFIQD